MSTRITIDPITRIEGHLRIDVEVENYAVSNAWASCTMWRGIETILRGRDPRDAWMFTQRFCGVCTTVHAMASVRAVEDALKLPVPANAQYIRNLILIAHALHDHIVHFYQLSALDWVDILADPEGRSGGRVEAGGDTFAVDAEFAQRTESRAGQGQGRGRERAARHLPERILGTSGDAAVARSQPARVHALRAGARVSAQGAASCRDAGLEDAAHSESGRRRRGERDRPRQLRARSRWTSSKRSGCCSPRWRSLSAKFM